ncbi:MAG TPA: alpha/beta fold hydrolase [Acidimicrobiales bacterium]|nr:alpha/beta fold hydrolase [Acidimicrobiales bacterium]
MDRYEADGLVFDVTDDGPPDGEVVVLLHGYPETRASWEGVVPFLVEDGYRVLAPDQRGYSPGARPRGRRAYRLDHLVDDVVALADAAGAGRVHVVGHDWGGAVAWALAGSHPGRLYSMTSLATPHPRAFSRSLVSSTQALHSWYMLFFQLPWLPELSMRGPGQRLVRRTLRRSGLAEAHIGRYLSLLSQPGAATAAINWYRALPLAPSPTPPIEVPVMYVYGTGDFALGRRAADLTRSYVNGPYRYEVLEGTSHWIPEEAPAVVGRLLREHLATHGARGN